MRMHSVLVLEFEECSLLMGCEQNSAAVGVGIDASVGSDVIDALVTVHPDDIITTASLFRTPWPIKVVGRCVLSWPVTKSRQQSLELYSAYTRSSCSSVQHHPKTVGL